jgi:membrane protein
MQLRSIYDVLKQAVHDFSEDKVPRLGAALAYYSVFSLAPLLIIAIGITSLLFGERAAHGQILTQIEGTVGEPVARSLEEMLRHAHQNGGGVIATVVGVVVLLFGASGVFVQMQDSLNTIWHVAPKPDRSWWAVVRERFLSFAAVLCIGFLLLVSLLASAAISAVSNFLTPASLPGSSYLWQLVNNLVAFGFITLLLALMYKVLPDVHLHWRDVWIGAAVTALLFNVGKYLIGLYLANTGTASAFGAAGSLVIILVWVYYSSQIVLFGAELTRTLVKREGHEIVPTDNAIFVDDSICARQGAPSRQQLEAALRQGSAGRSLPQRSA